MQQVQGNGKQTVQENAVEMVKNKTKQRVQESTGQRVHEKAKQVVHETLKIGLQKNVEQTLQENLEKTIQSDSNLDDILNDLIHGHLDNPLDHLVNVDGFLSDYDALHLSDHRLLDEALDGDLDLPSNRTRGHLGQIPVLLPSS